MQRNRIPLNGTRNYINGYQARQVISKRKDDLTRSTMKWLWKLFHLLSLVSANSGSGSGFTLNDEQCLICEFVGVANSENDALYMLAGANETDGNPWIAVPGGIADLLEPCLHGALSEAFDEALVNGIITHDSTDAAFCVASFFLFHAMDIDRWVYGVKRTVSSTDQEGLTELSHYEGIKAYSVSVPRTNVNEAGTVPSYSEQNYEHVDGSTFGINARYTVRGGYRKFFNQSIDEVDDGFQVFAMDGREIAPGEQKS